MRVIVAHEDQGTFVYANALALLQHRIEQKFWYAGDDAAMAREATVSEDRALRFLNSRRNYEYEYIEEQGVIGA